MKVARGEAAEETVAAAWTRGAKAGRRHLRGDIHEAAAAVAAASPSLHFPLVFSPTCQRQRKCRAAFFNECVDYSQRPPNDSAGSGSGSFNVNITVGGYQKG